MISRVKLERRLAVQAGHEGEASVALCRLVLAQCRTSAEWAALTVPRFRRYGTQSYEVHIFYDVKPWVLTLAQNLERQRSVNRGATSALRRR